jgi:aconitase A
MSDLEPQINGPFTPDLANPLSQFADNARREGWPLEVSGEQAGAAAGWETERKKQQGQLKPLQDVC